jgi:hypothetical protein
MTVKHSGQFGLSKSRIAAFEQCPRRLWLQTHRKDLAFEDEATQDRYRAGNLVGEVACSLVPCGIMVEAEPDLRTAIQITTKLIDDGQYPIFEGTFSHDGVLVRVDIMEPDKQGSWHVAEVKSSTSAKEYHVNDLATQIWVMEQCGVTIASASIRHIDSSFTLQNLGEYTGLFADADQSGQIGSIVATRQIVVDAARNMLAGDEPECATGAHCNSPFACEFSHWCSRDEPAGPEWPISELPRSGAKVAEKWAAHGVADLRELPDDAGLGPMHEKIRQAVITGTPFLDRDGVIKDTEGWAFPRIWIDFETITFAVPRWVGTRPYEQIPFQFSAHIEYEDGHIEHVECLDLSGNDPRPAIASALAQLPSDGAAIAWNAGFERGCFRSLANAVPAHADALRSLEARTVDLLPIARNHYYHPNQRGSWSIKKVLPTIAPELDYSTLDVQDGGNAQAAYLEAISIAGDEQRRRAIDAALKDYCGRDTWAMIAIYRRFMGLQIPAAQLPIKANLN